MAVQCLDAEVAAADGLGEGDFLPSVALLQGTRVYGSLTAQVELLSLQAVGLGTGQVQLVDDGLLESLHGSLLGTYYISHDDFVDTLLEPASGHVERLLGTDLPEASDGMSIDIYLSLAERLHVDERVAHLAEGEGGAVVSTYSLVLLGEGFVLHLRLGLVVIGQTVDFPVLQVDVDL